MNRYSMFAAAVTLALIASPAAAVDVNQIQDLTAGVVPRVVFEQHDTFSNEFTYSVKVTNQTGDPIVADTLIIVLDGVLDTAGKDALDRIEVVKPDGFTAAGQPYFRVPPDKAPELPPFSESRPVTVRLRAPDYTTFFAPSFRVRGQRRTTAESLQDLIQDLRKKGVLTEEEARRALERQRRQSP
jgi:hypothetical protein